MPRPEQTLERVLSGRSDANILFNDLRRMLEWLGSRERIEGSHHIFTRANIRDRVNIRREVSQAKAYQVRQVRKTLLQYGIGGEHE